MTEKLEIGKEIMDLAIDLLSACRERGELIATAESCTGGLVAGTLTAIPGASDVFERGFVTYSNASKSEMLGVPVWLIERHGAVSEDVARAMAGGALTHSRATLAVPSPASPGPTAERRRSRLGLCISPPAGAMSRLCMSGCCLAIWDAARFSAAACSRR